MEYLSRELNQKTHYLGGGFWQSSLEWFGPFVISKLHVTALGNAKPTYLLDHKLFDFKNLKAGTGDVESELDLAVGHTHENLQPALVSIM